MSVAYIIKYIKSKTYFTNNYLDLLEALLLMLAYLSNPSILRHFI